MVKVSWRGMAPVLLTLILISISAGKVNLKTGPVEPGKPSMTAFGTENTEPGYHIVEFEQLPDRAKINIKGLELLGYIPENAYYADLTRKAIQKLDNNPNVQVLDIDSQHRISPAFKEKTLDTSETRTLYVQFFNNTSPDQKQKFVGKNGKLISKGISWKIKTNKAPEQLAKGPVKWVRPIPPALKAMNQGSRDLIEVDMLEEWDSKLNGSGLTAGIWDGGWAAKHMDLNYSGKLFRGDAGCTETYCQISDHATHVAGTMLGAGIKNSQYRGIAPNASLATYEWPENNSELINEHEDAVNNYNAEVSQNSWGFDLSCSNNFYLGAYTSRSAGYDDVIAGDTVVEKIPVVFAAGNLGGCSGDNSTLTGPGATAKNTIVVGSLDGKRTRSSFSSYGPTDDGRIKPDLMAKGESLTSTIPGNSYTSKQGTSMAAPGVSGAVLLLQQEFRQEKNRNATPAELRGMLIQTATDLQGQGPDYETGWGLVNVSRALDYLRSEESGNLMRNGSLTNGEKNTYDLNVESSANITLVWSDPAAESSSGFNLVNNLDLIVRNSTGHRFYPWTMNSSRASQDAWRNKSDDLNNVEQVYIPEEGQVTVEVKGTKVPEPSQDYTLLLDSSIYTVPDLTIESPDNKTYTNKSIYFNVSTDIDIEKAVYSIDGGSNKSMENDSQTHFFKKQDVVDGSHNVSFYVKHSTGGWNSSTRYFSVDTEPPKLWLYSPENKAYSTDIIDLNYSTKNADRAFYNKGFGNTTITENKSFEFSEGSHDIKLYSEDEHRNLNSTNRSFTVDTVPEIKLYSPGNTSYSGSLDLNYWVDQNATVKYNLGSGNQTVNGNTSLNLEDSSYNLTVYATDPKGNTDKANASFTVDSKKPEITVNAPKGNYSEIFGEINISVKDNSSIKWAKAELQSYEEYIAGEKVANYSLIRNNSFFYNQTVSFNETKYNTTYYVMDEAGNLGKLSDSFIIDDTPPSPIIRTIDNTTYNTEVLWANMTSTEGLKSAQLFINGTERSFNRENSTFYYSKLNLKPGKANLSINATDKFNNTYFGSAFFTIENLPPSINRANPRDLYKVNDTVKIGYNVKEETPDSFSLNITYPNSTSITRYLNKPENNPYPTSFKVTELFNSTQQIGNYTVEIKVNDTYSRKTSVERDFEVRKPVNLTLNFSDGENKTKTDYKLFTKNYTANKSGVSNTTEEVPEGIWSLEIGNSSKAVLKKINLSRNTNATVNWSEKVSTNKLERENTEFKEVLAAKTDLNFSEAELEINYTEIENPKLLRCGDWEFSSENCGSDWQEVSDADFSSGTAKANISSFSAYSVVKETESSTDSSGDSGGSGGGGGSSGGGATGLSTSQQQAETQIKEERTVENDQAVFRNINITRNKKLDLEGLEGLDSITLITSSSESRMNLTIKRQAFEVNDFRILKAYNLDSSLQNSRFRINFSVGSNVLNNSNLNVYDRRQGWESTDSKKLVEEPDETYFSAALSAPTEFAIGLQEINNSPAKKQSTVNRTEKKSSDPSQRPQSLVLPVVSILLLVLFGSAGYIGFRIHKRRSLRKKIEQITSEMKENLQGGGKLPKDSMVKVEHAQKAMRLGKYSKAEKIMEELESEL